MLIYFSLFYILIVGQIMSQKASDKLNRVAELPAQSPRALNADQSTFQNTYSMRALRHLGTFVVALLGMSSLNLFERLFGKYDSQDILQSTSFALLLQQARSQSDLSPLLSSSDLAALILAQTLFSVSSHLLSLSFEHFQQQACATGLISGMTQLVPSGLNLALMRQTSEAGARLDKQLALKAPENAPPGKNTPDDLATANEQIVDQIFAETRDCMYALVKISPCDLKVCQLVKYQRRLGNLILKSERAQAKTQLEDKLGEMLELSTLEYSFSEREPVTLAKWLAFHVQTYRPITPDELLCSGVFTTSLPKGNPCLAVFLVEARYADYTKGLVLLSLQQREDDSEKPEIIFMEPEEDQKVIVDNNSTIHMLVNEQNSLATPTKNSISSQSYSENDIKSLSSDRNKSEKLQGRLLQVESGDRCSLMEYQSWESCKDDVPAEILQPSQIRRSGTLDFITNATRQGAERFHLELKQLDAFRDHTGGDSVQRKSKVTLLHKPFASKINLAHHRTTLSSACLLNYSNGLSNLSKQSSKSLRYTSNDIRGAAKYDKHFQRQGECMSHSRCVPTVQQQKASLMHHRFKLVRLIHFLKRNAEKKQRKARRQRTGKLPKSHKLALSMAEHVQEGQPEDDSARTSQRSAHSDHELLIFKVIHDLRYPIKALINGLQQAERKIRHLPKILAVLDVVQGKLQSKAPAATAHLLLSKILALMDQHSQGQLSDHEEAKESSPREKEIKSDLLSCLQNAWNSSRQGGDLAVELDLARPADVSDMLAQPLLQPDQPNACAKQVAVWELAIEEEEEEKAELAAEAPHEANLELERERAQAHKNSSREDGRNQNELSDEEDCEIPEEESALAVKGNQQRQRCQVGRPSEGKLLAEPIVAHMNSLAVETSLLRQVQNGRMRVQSHDYDDSSSEQHGRTFRFGHNPETSMAVKICNLSAGICQAETYPENNRINNSSSQSLLQSMRSSNRENQEQALAQQMPLRSNDTNRILEREDLNRDMEVGPANERQQYWLQGYRLSDERVFAELATTAKAILEERSILGKEISSVSKLHRQVQRTLQELRGHANMSMHLLTDMMDFAQFKSNAFSLHNEYFDMKRIVKDSFRMIKQQALIKRISLRGPFFEQSSHMPFFTHFYGDMYRYKQVLVNFVSNAIKFTPEQGEVSVTLSILNISKKKLTAPLEEEKGEMGDEQPLFDLADEEEDNSSHSRGQDSLNSSWESALEKDSSLATDQSKTEGPIEVLITFKLIVSDTGCGISKANQQKLFKHFSRLEDKEGQNKQGVGLGLTICSQIVMLYGGSINIESEEGVGTSFIVTLKTSCLVKSEEYDAFFDGLPAFQEFRTINEMSNELSLNNMSFGPSLTQSAHSSQSPQVNSSSSQQQASLSLRSQAPSSRHHVLSNKSALEPHHSSQDAEEEGKLQLIPMPEILEDIDLDDNENPSSSSMSSKQQSRQAASASPYSSNKAPALMEYGFEELELRCLLANDSEFQVKEYACKLRRFFKTVVVKMDGAQAVEEVLGKPHDYYDAIVLDIDMPHKTGLEACQEITAHFMKCLTNLNVEVETVRAEACQESMNSMLALPAREAFLLKLHDQYGIPPIFACTSMIDPARSERIEKAGFFGMSSEVSLVFVQTILRAIGIELALPSNEDEFCSSRSKAMSSAAQSIADSVSQGRSLSNSLSSQKQ